MSDLMSKVCHLSGEGPVLVSTDLHGCWEDFVALERRFEALCQRDPRARWVLLGDLVHGPSPEIAARQPELYGYEDASAAIVARVAERVVSEPERVLFVLGNHDHAHLDGRPTRKFYDDERAHLESGMSPEAVAQLRGLFEGALLAVSTSCGALLTHGSPGVELTSLDDLGAIDLRPGAFRTQTQRDMLETVLWSYGQLPEITDQMLAQINHALPPAEAQRVVIHGHDRDEAGWFVEGHNQLCPVIFGAHRADRRCVILDLSARYTSVEALCRPDVLVRVHG